MEDPAIRQATTEDQSVVGRLWTALLDEQAAHDDRMQPADDARERWENDFPFWIADETRRIVVAEPDDEVVGFASARRWGPPPIYQDEEEVFLDEVYVMPSARRQGLGTQLVGAVQDWADDLGAHRIRFRVLASNEAARRFWAAQEAVPLSETLTIRRPGPDADDPDEGSAKIGF